MFRSRSRGIACVIAATAVLLTASVGSAHDPREFGPFRGVDGQPIVPGGAIARGLGGSLAVAGRPERPVLDNFRVVGHLEP